MAEPTAGGYLLRKGIDALFSTLVESLRRSSSQTTTSRIDLEQAVSYHVREIRNWSSEISFADLKGPKATSDVFIPLDLMLSPRRYRASPDEPSEAVALESLIGDPSTGHVVILGQPGAGKTTSMKHICQRLLEDPDFATEIDFPVLIRLRDLNSPSGKRTTDRHVVLSKLQEALGIKIGHPKSLAGKEHAAERRAIRERAIIDCADAARILLILEGFDEITSAAQREVLIAEVRTLAQQFEKSRMALTSRTGEFNYHIENMHQFEISPLSAEQIRDFACRWLGTENGMTLVEQIGHSPFADTAIRPLTIAHLCAIFERSGKIPDKPKTVYRKIVTLLIEEWDQQRSIKRSSPYSSFDVDRKFEFLSQLAYVLTVSLGGSSFSKQDLVAAYRMIHGNYGLPAADATRVANELETHTGLFVQAGYEFFEFSHKSLQEFLTAEFIVRLPKIPIDVITIESLPNELAIATAISSTPSEYFTELVVHRFNTLQMSFGFASAFVSRLLLERPDFEVTPRVGAALLALYSQYLHSVFSSSAQLHLFVIDRLGRDFEELGKLIQQRIFQEDLMSVFEMVEEPPSVEGGRILRLSKRIGWTPRPSSSRSRESVDAQRMLERTLPESIWVRPSLLASLYSDRSSTPQDP